MHGRSRGQEPRQALWDKLQGKQDESAGSVASNTVHSVHGSPRAIVDDSLQSSMHTAVPGPAIGSGAAEPASKSSHPSPALPGMPLHAVPGPGPGLPPTQLALLRVGEVYERYGLVFEEVRGGCSSHPTWQVGRCTRARDGSQSHFRAVGKGDR